MLSVLLSHNAGADELWSHPGSSAIRPHNAKGVAAIPLRVNISSDEGQLP